MALTIQERLKDLRVERGLTLKQLAEQTRLSKSALGSYEADEHKDISHCPYQAGEVLRRDRQLSAGIDGNEKSPKRRSCRPAFE